jgi:hopene-associated glycosyltransferase HpnB
VLPQPPDYLLFTDADIVYAPGTLTEIVKRTERDELVLASLMAKLHCVSFGERALIPAYIFFFQLLYPFAWVNRPERATAAAAGGCMLIRRSALQAAGGIASIRGELIDDCALGRLLKMQGPIWLGLTERARSLRAFRSVGDIRPMIARSAYAQLRYSPWLLIGTVLAIAVTCLAPLLLTVGATGLPMARCGVRALMAMYAADPALHGVSRWWGPSAGIAAAYFTLDSAYQHWRAGRHVEGQAPCTRRQQAIIKAAQTETSAAAILPCLAARSTVWRARAQPLPNRISVWRMSSWMPFHWP